MAANIFLLGPKISERGTVFASPFFTPSGPQVLPNKKIRDK